MEAYDKKFLLYIYQTAISNKKIDRVKAHGSTLPDLLARFGELVLLSRLAELDQGTRCNCTIFSEIEVTDG